MQDAASYYAVSAKTVRRWIAKGDLTAKRIGPRIIRVDLRSLESAGRAIGGRT